MSEVRASSFSEPLVFKDIYFWERTTCLIFKSLLYLLTFVNYEGLYFAEGFLLNLCLCFGIAFAQLGVISRTRNTFVEIAAVQSFSQREQVFSKYNISLFHKRSCSHELHVCNSFDRYLKGLELMRNSSGSHLISEWPLKTPYKRRIAATHSFKFTVFAEQELQQGDIIVTTYGISLVSRMYILEEVCYFTTSITAIHFFHGSAIISREHLKRFICQGHCLFHNTCRNHLL